MLPKTHIILGGIFSILVWIIHPTIPWFNIVLIFLSSFLIDFDHYMYYVFKKKDINPFKSTSWFMKNHKNGVIKKFEKKNSKNKVKAYFCAFHTVELLLLIFIFALFIKPFLFILLGMLFHSLLDVIDLTIRKDIHLREFSTIAYIIRRNKKEWKYF